MPISLPIYSESYRPSSDWIKSIVEKQQILSTFLPLDPVLEEKVQNHLLINEITNNLRISLINIEQEKVIEASKNNFQQPSELEINNFSDSIKYVNTLVKKFQESGLTISLTSSSLREIHRLLFKGSEDTAGFYRKTIGNCVAEGHQPAEADLLPFLVDNALEWFEAESFKELHPIEQAWLVHLRIIDLQPFQKGNGRVARLVASFFSQKANLLPIIVNSKEIDFYNYAVKNALTMITQPGVELFARSVNQTYDEVLSIVKSEE